MLEHKKIMFDCYYCIKQCVAGKLENFDRFAPVNLLFPVAKKLRKRHVHCMHLQNVASMAVANIILTSWFLLLLPCTY